ncbi:MAG: hypothetical protein NTX79_00680 [Candidatus Micrarchaeota archaeon]|nr:hypothetical protein [Candidatus Micrarchaeota archaeon]
MALKLVMQGCPSKRDVKEMWKACERAKKSGDTARYETAVKKVVEKMSSKEVSNDDVKAISEKVQPCLEDYGTARKQRWSYYVRSGICMAEGAVAFSGSVACFIGGVVFMQTKDAGPAGLVLLLIAGPAGMALALTYGIERAREHLHDSILQLSWAAESVCNCMLDAIHKSLHKSEPPMSPWG